MMLGLTFGRRSWECTNALHTFKSSQVKSRIQKHRGEPGLKTREIMATHARSSHWRTSAKATVTPFLASPPRSEKAKQRLANSDPRPARGQCWLRVRAAVMSLLSDIS